MSDVDVYRLQAKGRSREGAWIEILKLIMLWLSVNCRSREGAWIEILGNTNTHLQVGVAPVRERGLKYCA